MLKELHLGNDAATVRNKWQCASCEFANDSAKRFGRQKNGKTKTGIEPLGTGTIRSVVLITRWRGDTCDKI